MKCFNCQQDGHVASQCTWQNEITDPAARDTPWCGTCDPRTRQIAAGGPAARCPECHPLRARMLAQHKRCPHCHKVTVAWDTAQDCEHHILAGVTREFVSLDRKAGSRLLDDDELRELAGRQVAESRAARVVLP